MFENVVDKEYLKNLMEYFDKNLPEKIYDAHTHISRARMERIGYDGTPIDEFRNFFEAAIPRKLDGCLLMAAMSVPAENVYDENLYIASVARENGFKTGMTVTPNCKRDVIEKMLKENSEIALFKPYMTYAPDIANRYETDMLDFAPEWIWEMANDHEFPVLIHLSHYQNMLSEKANWEQIRYVSEKYPKAKIILAHCAMGHNVRKLRLGLEHIRDLKNIWFDCSGSTETMSIYYCLKAFGPQRMMYGADHDHGANFGRIVSYGSNFLAIHNVNSLHNGEYPTSYGQQSDYKYQPLTNAHEGILCLLEATEVLGLTKENKENIFYNNAYELFKG